MSKVTQWASLWDTKSFDGTCIIGVNWAAVGPVTPNKARIFARRVMRVADMAEKRRLAARAKGLKLKPLPLSS